MKTIEQLQEENAALAAQVEALRDAGIDALRFLMCQRSIDAQACYRELSGAITATPQHHLREVRAEAGRAGYLACATEYGLENAHASKEGIARNANQYAEQIRRGGVE